MIKLARVGLEDEALLDAPEPWVARVCPDGVYVSWASCMEVVVEEADFPEELACCWFTKDNNCMWF